MRFCDKPTLKISNSVIKDVNGENLKVYGTVQIKINFEKETFEHSVIICDILPEGILGQDFLLKNVTKIDYCKLKLSTYTVDIPCWIGGEAEMVCYIQSNETIVIPPDSKMFIPVNIPKCEHLSKFRVLEPSVEPFEGNDIAITPGVIDTQSNEEIISVLNFGNEDVTIYPNMRLGTCESFYETDQNNFERCAQIVHAENTEPSLQNQLPEYLEDLFSRSAVNLNETERQDLAKLLTKYQNVFSKSKGGLGHTDLVQHKINTESAVPIRQSLRRLPFGKRQTEKEEILRMLDLGVIEPSSSPWSSPGD